MSDTKSHIENQQIRASDPAIHAWVSASAGAGKTTVLVRRILRLLLTKGVNPENILAITYTKAAANEMANRIGKNLTQWAVCEESALTQILQRILAYTPKTEDIRRARHLFARVLDAKGGLKIQTIHSFCQSLLQRFPFEANITQGFKVVEDVTPILQECKIRVLDEENLRKTNIQHHFSIRALANGGAGFDNDLEKIIADREKFKRLFAQYTSMDDLIKCLYAKLNIGKRQTVQQAKMHYKNGVMQENITHILQAHMKNIQAIKDPKATLLRRLQDLKSWFEHSNIDAFNTAMFTKEGKLNTSTKVFKRDSVELLHPIQQAYDRYITEKNTVEIAQETAAMYHIAKVFIEMYEKIKQERNILDFDDIIVKTEKLLSNPTIAPWILHKTDRGHMHILLDESQDTSPVQWRVIEHLLNPFFDGSKDTHNTVFAVGDEKQSIYAFQGADPQGFMKAKTTFAERAKIAHMPFETIELNASFRSAPAVLEWVDKTFLHSWQGVAGRAFSHRAINESYTGEICLLPLLQAEACTVKPDVLWAEEIAEGIRHQIGRYLPCKNRRVTERDIIVLVRSRTPFVTALMRALKTKNIPVAGVDHALLKEKIAVEDICAFLQFMLLPQDDLNLACVLKGPLIGLEEEQIFPFANGRGDLCLWKSLQKYNNNTGNLALVLTYLRSWLNCADYMRPFETINRILHTPCPLGTVKGLGNVLYGYQAFNARLGVEAKEPLANLLQVAMDFENTEIPTLQGFLHYMDTKNVKCQSGGEHTQRNEVRIMTVHSAKGLQAPVVILPDCFKPLRLSSGFLWQQDTDHVFCLWFANKRANTRGKNSSNQSIQYTSSLPNHILRQVEQKEIAESKRLLYVAMTRAENILICGGKSAKGHKNLQAQDTCWYAYLHRGMKNLNIHGQKYVPYSRRYTDVWQKQDGAENPYGGQVYSCKTPSATGEPTVNIYTEKGQSYHIPLPDWIFSHADCSAQSLQQNSSVVVEKQIAPSKILNTEDVLPLSPLKGGNKEDLFRRGTLIHRVLEFLPTVAVGKREQFLKKYLSRPAFALAPKVQQQWSTEILALMHTYDFLFDEGGRAEVPVAGKISIDGTPHYVSGVIDRLVVKKDTVWIIDFKSDRIGAHAVYAPPKKYTKQLEIYKKVLGEIYPKKTIRSVLMWTYYCKGTEV